jgi:hypothetical protein
MRATLLGFLSFAFLSLSVPVTAHAENCVTVQDNAFARIRMSAPRAPSQSAADQEIETLFGPRPTKCEEGAYQRFLDNYEAFAREAIRAAQPQHQGKRVIPASPASENMLRLAIAAIRKQPAKVPAKEAKAAINAYRQTRSNLSAVVEDAGSTPAMGSLLSALNAMRAPDADDSAPGIDPTTTTTTTTTTTPTTTTTSTDPKNNVTAIRVPTVAMPTWAIIKLYEARDAAALKDADTAKLKLQDIVIWIESVTQGQ